MARRSPGDRGDRRRRSAGGLGESLPVKMIGLWDDIKTLLAMLLDLVAGRYRSVPLKTLAVLIFAVLYLVSPIDLVPDFIPFIGYLDDAFIFILAIDLVRDDLQAYRVWKQQRGSSQDGEQ